MPILTKNKNVIDVGAPCSLTIVKDKYVAFANYKDIYLLNKETGETKLLSKPKGVDIWVPTGLKWSTKDQLLYVANYKGHDILLLKLTDQNELELVQRFTDPDLESPENVDVLEEQKLFAVADYDGNKVILFNEKGKLWSHHIGLAHGVAFNKKDKPSPLPVFEALRPGSLHPEEHDVWFVGDSIVDVHCARAAGCIPMVVGQGGASLEDDVIHVKTCEGLMQLIENL